VLHPNIDGADRKMTQDIDNDDPQPLDDVTALGLLQAIYKDPNLPLPVRHRAARDALPYEAPRLSVVANVSEGLGDRLDALLKRRIAYTEQAMKQIEAKVEDKPKPTEFVRRRIS
jgi:hypothetical protein